MHILILNYNPLHTAFLKKALRYESISTDTCRPENVKAIWYGQYDAIIAAVEEWTMQKYEEVKAIVVNLGNIPAIITAKGEPPVAIKNEISQNSRLTAVSTYLPFHNFLHALRVIIKENQAPSSKEHILRIGELRIDLSTREVKRSKKSVRLRHQEFNLLSCMMQNANKVLTRTYLLENVWDRNLNLMSNTVDVHIARLRRKIDDPYAKKYIQTIPQVGYKLATQ